MSFQVIDRNAILDDERVQRLKKIKLLERENRENLPKFQEKQAQQFPTALPLSNNPTLGQVISEETQKISLDPEIVFQRAEAKLITIAPKEATDYILDRLDDEEMYYLVNSWDGITKKLREQYSTKGLDKEVFIRLIKADTDKFRADIASVDVGLSNRGQLRKEQSRTQTDELREKLDKEKREQKMKRDTFNDLVKRNEFNYTLLDELVKKFDMRNQGRDKLREAVTSLLDEILMNANGSIIDSRNALEKIFAELNVRNTDENVEIKNSINDVFEEAKDGVEEEKQDMVRASTVRPKRQENKDQPNLEDKEENKVEEMVSKVLDNEPFKAYGASQLTGEYETFYTEAKDRIKYEVKKSTIEEVDEALKHFEIENPKKYRILLLIKDPREKLIKFLERLTLDEVLEAQEKGGFKDLKQRPKTNDVEMFKDYIEKMNKKQLVEMAKALGITGAAKKNVATLKELIYEKDGKEIDDYLDGIGANEYSDPKEEVKKK